MSGELISDNCLLNWTTNSTTSSGHWGQWWRAGHAPPAPAPAEHGAFMGHTMVTRLSGHEYRYTEWPRILGLGKVDWSDLAGRELYNHTVDFEENSNVVGQPGYTAIATELSKQLRDGWRAALLPPLLAKTDDVPRQLLKTEDENSRRMTGCRTDHDCSLNGRCLANTLKCACRPEWYGSQCENLRMGISPRAASIHGVDGSHSSAWTWGGSPAVDANGTHHLFFSFLTNGCGLLHYQTNSVVKHAVAKTAAGPWRVVGVSLEPRTGLWDSGAIHGPSIAYDKASQRWLLFYMGTTVTRPRPDCRADPTAAAFMNSSSRRIGLAWSPSIAPGEERWQRVGNIAGSEQYNSGMILRPRKGKWDSGDVSNPAPLVLSNGSIMLGYRAGGDTMAAGDAGIGMAFATSWNSSFLRRQGCDDMLFGTLTLIFLWMQNPVATHLTMTY